MAGTIAGVVLLLVILCALALLFSKPLRRANIMHKLRNKNLIRQTYARNPAVFYAWSSGNEDVRTPLFDGAAGEFEFFLIEPRERRVRTESSVIINSLSPHWITDRRPVVKLVVRLPYEWFRQLHTCTSMAHTVRVELVHDVFVRRSVPLSRRAVDLCTVHVK